MLSSDDSNRSSPIENNNSNHKLKKRYLSRKAYSEALNKENNKNYKTVT